MHIFYPFFVANVVCLNWVQEWSSCGTWHSLAGFPAIGFPILAPTHFPVSFSIQSIQHLEKAIIIKQCSHLLVMACLMSSWCQFSYACICSFLQLCVAKGSPTVARFRFCFSLDIMARNILSSLRVVCSWKEESVLNSRLFPHKEWNTETGKGGKKVHFHWFRRHVWGYLRAEMEHSSVQILRARPECVFSAS